MCFDGKFGDFFFESQKWEAEYQPKFSLIFNVEFGFKQQEFVSNWTCFQF